MTRIKISYPTDVARGTRYLTKRDHGLFKTEYEGDKMIIRCSKTLMEMNVNLFRKESIKKSDQSM